MKGAAAEMSRPSLHIQQTPFRQKTALTCRAEHAIINGVASLGEVSERFKELVLKTVGVFIAKGLKTLIQ